MVRPENNPVSPSLENTSPASEENGLISTLQRVQADYDNYRKRAQGEMNQHYLRGKATVWKDILSLLDTLDAAISNEKNGTRRALESVRAHLLNIMHQHGIKPMHTLGKPFDPFTSECLMQGNDPAQEEDVVLQEIQRGYFFHEDVLRPARVKVNKPVHPTSNNSHSTTGGNPHE